MDNKKKVDRQAFASSFVDKLRKESEKRVFGKLIGTHRNKTLTQYQ